MHKDTKDINPEDVASDSKDQETDLKIEQLEERVIALERMLMRILDAIELDYPGLML